MKHRNLRIAWSTIWGLLVVMLIALWVHTLHRQMRLERWLANSIYVRSAALRHWMEVEPRSYAIGPPGTWYPPANFQDYPVNAQQEITASPVRRWRCSVGSDPTYSHIALTFPFWFPLLFATAFAVAPWILPIAKLKRFGLRTLLIATTLVAIALGLIVWITS